ncbi:YtxH domain-containing protein [Bacillus sp. RAR_GA_16]|uniref:YtxH domain-containing protein n=1 Tax=Bacillus sp. RAR_GA_16 TaxID=2876774 RepID=UPI001CCB1BAA|nr:YtxH domain-containing protein [Bacillus sp. RAR_GA_16]MCA0171451.1 YtxH domain-containing protein [Bacillus sp. RAR_GA_16]
MKESKSNHDVKVEHEPAPEGYSSSTREVIRIDSSDPIKSESQFKGPAIAALAGSVVGAAAGVLLAPKAGKELRNDISGGVTKAKDKSVEVTSNVKNKSNAFAQSVKTKSNDIVSKVKNRKADSSQSEEEALVSGYSIKRAAELDETEVPTSTVVNHDIEKIIVETEGADTFDDVIQQDVERTLERDPDHPETLDEAAELELERTYKNDSN